MNWIDYIIIAVIIFSALISIVNGFLREILSLISWIAAFFISSRFYYYITDYLTYFSDESVRRSVAIAILFIVVLIFCTIISYLIGLVIKKTGLSFTDRLLGIFFGLVRGVLIVAAILFFISLFTQLSKSEAWQSSQLIPQFDYIVHWFFDFWQQHYY